MRNAGITALAALLLLLAAPVGAAIWQVPGDFPTIQAAIDDGLVIAGDRIMVGPGSHAGATVTKQIEIRGEGGATITSGPAHGSGLSQGFRLLTGSDGATISHLTFEVDLAIMNADAVNDVTVTQCTFTDAVQAISNWRGSGWEISHNVINDLQTRNGGGIGILIADFSGGIVIDNVVSHNRISGTLHVGGACPTDPSCENGGYSGTGIVLFADFRWNRLGAEHISFNRVVKNRVSLVSDNAGLVDVVAFEMTDTRDTTADVITDNAIGFNDWRGTTNQMAFTPASLDNPVNDISRNFGSNRGQGLHPSLFGPGGN